MQENNNKIFNQLKIHTQYSICEGAIKIEDLIKFFDDIMDIYFTATNEYQTEYEKIRTKRTVSGLVDYEQK